jgi:hypothetical protein
MAETPEGFAMGEAASEADARLMIESQRRGSVTFNETAGRYRWTVVASDGKASHGYADTESDAWWYVKEAVNRPYRGTHYRGPRCRWVREP